MPSTPNNAPSTISATGAQALTVSAPSTRYSVTAAGVAAMTLAAPDRDGIELVFIDEGGHAHTVVASSLNGGTTNNKLTWNGTAGSSAILISRGTNWWTAALNGVAVS